MRKSGAVACRGDFVRLGDRFDQLVSVHGAATVDVEVAGHVDELLLGGLRRHHRQTRGPLGGDETSSQTLLGATVGPAAQLREHLAFLFLDVVGDAALECLGMEAHGSPAAKAAHTATAILPSSVAAKLMKTAGVDRLAALHTAFELVRRGGTVSVVGVYGGMTDPMPMMTMLDKQIQLRMGQANVRRWVDDIVPLLVDDDPLDVDTFATHHLPLTEAPAAYSMFQKKADGAIKVVFNP